jgi:hypothetical protein
MRNVSDKICRENQNSHFTFNFFFRKSCALKDNMEKYGRAGQATNDNTVRFACCITKATDTYSRICNTYRFSTATVVTRTRLDVTSYVHFHSCFFLIRTKHINTLQTECGSLGVKPGGKHINHYPLER